MGYLEEPAACRQLHIVTQTAESASNETDPCEVEGLAGPGCLLRSELPAMTTLIEPLRLDVNIMPAQAPFAVHRNSKDKVGICDHEQ